MKIGIPDDYADMVRSLAALKQLDGHEVTIWTDAERDVETLTERFKDLDALVLLRERTHLPAALFKKLPKLKLIAMNGGNRFMDVAACTANGTLFCAGHSRRSYATAELAFGLILASMRQIPQQMARLLGGQWQSELGTVLRGRTLGIMGYGKIGGTVASYGKAFGMTVIVSSRERGLKEAEADGYIPVADRAEFFRRCDVLSLHTRYSPETKGIVTAADLALMKPTALLVNTSRSELIEPGALAAALKMGRPGRAAIDVYETEPNPVDSLIGMEQVICTPHLGYFERDQMESYFAANFDRVLAYAAGKPVDVQNPQALQAAKHKGA